MDIFKNCLKWGMGCVVTVAVVILCSPSMKLYLHGMGGHTISHAVDFIASTIIAYWLVRNSKDQDCWQYALIFGFLCFAAVVVFSAFRFGYLVIPLEALFVIPGATLGGLLRWVQLQPTDKTDLELASEAGG